MYISSIELLSTSPLHKTYLAVLEGGLDDLHVGRQVALVQRGLRHRGRELREEGGRGHQEVVLQSSMV